MNNIDKIFFINLDRRPDRLKQFMDQYKHFNFDPEKLERFSAISIEDNPTLGCHFSHLQVIKIARQRNYKNVLIFEDDFMFLIEPEHFYQKLKDFFSLNLDFSVLMLAYFHHNETRINDLVSSTSNASNAAGYLVNHSCYDELIEKLEYGLEMLENTGEHWNYVNDQIWKKLQGDKWLIFNERVGKQRPSYSDLSKQFVDYNV